jgi:translation initiation factor 2-alpha kinase 4
LSISLNPQQGSSGCHEIYVYVDLCIICDEIYPNSVPKIKLEHSKGLSDNSLKELQNKLEKNAEELKGEEMIFQLAQYVQEFLHGHNKPAPKSFYDEMMQRQREQEEKELQAQQMEDYRRKQIMQQEFQRRQEMLKLESRRRREQRYNSETSNEYDSDTRRQSISNNSFEISDESLCEHKETVIVNFGNRQIRIGQCLSESAVLNFDIWSDFWNFRALQLPRRLHRYGRENGRDRAFDRMDVEKLETIVQFRAGV